MRPDYLPSAPADKGALTRKRPFGTLNTPVTAKKTSKFCPFDNAQTGWMADGLGFARGDPIPCK